MQNRTLARSVEAYARPLLREFLSEKDGLNPTEWENMRLWLIASGQHKGRGVVTAKEARRLQQLTTDSHGWWTDLKTFIPLEQWILESDQLMEQYRRNK